MTTVDGDSNHAERELGRTQAHVILTNPDMIHHCFLRNHSAWARVFRNLRFITSQRKAIISHLVDSVSWTKPTRTAAPLVLTSRSFCVASFVSAVTMATAPCGSYAARPRWLIPPGSSASSYHRLSVSVRCCVVPCARGRQPGDNLVVVQEDGSAAGDRCIVLWNPAQQRLQRLGVVRAS